MSNNPRQLSGGANMIQLPKNPIVKERMKIFEKCNAPKPLLDEGLVLQACEANGIKPHNAYIMWRKIIQGNAKSVDEIEGLPKALYRIAKEDFAITTSTVMEKKHSKDGSTTKLLVKLADGQLVESVIMRYGCVQFGNSYPQNTGHKHKPGTVTPNGTFRSNPRATLCLSSQVGCAMGCTFCATGTMGLTSNLCAGEILEQLYHANQVCKIRNVVFMGMGEPLDNYNAVITAIRGMTDVQRFSLGYGQISVSTVGVAPRIRQLADDAPHVNLALSLHAPNQKLRTEIVPSSKAWHINKIVEALDYFIQCQNAVSRREKNTLVEYVLIKDVNDSEEVAHELGALLKDRSVLLNVIPYNPTEVPYDYHPPLQDTTDKFNKIVRTYKVRTIQRQELGQDIDGACGQLVVQKLETGKGFVAGAGGGCGTDDGKGAVDMEDLMGGKAVKQGPGEGDHRYRSNTKHAKKKGFGGSAKDAAPPAAAAAVEAAAATAVAAPSGGVDVYWVLGALMMLGVAFLLAKIVPRLMEQ